MISNLDKVIEFNNCFNHTVSDKEYIDIFESEPKLVDLRLKLIKEEIDELAEAFRNDDLVEIIDALTDILYVVYGLCACFGIQINTYYKKYILSMLDQTLLSNESEQYLFKNMSNFDMTKYLNNNNNTNPVILTKYKNNILNGEFKNKLIILLNEINEYYEGVELSCADQDYEPVIENILNLLLNTYMFGIIIGVNLDESFTIVHDSNMTKICGTELLAKETVSWYKSNETKYDSPIYKKNINGYIIINESTGKILKSIKYTPANFSSLLI